MFFYLPVARLPVLEVLFLWYLISSDAIFSTEESIIARQA